jgi:type II secretory pathway predicted ATPase ExeA
MATVDRQRLTAAQIVTSALDGEELIHVSARAFGLEVAGHDKATALAQIEAFLHHEAREGRRCLLVVDESQNLSVEALEELRMLSNFQLGAHPLLQILLLGQPEFRTLLQTSPELEQLRQRVIASHHLDAMEPSEIGAYIEHRLACVGWQGNPAFDARVYADLAKATGGVPRRINQIVNRVLLMAAIEQRQSIDAALLQAVIADLAGDGGLNAKPAVSPVPASEAPVVELPSAQPVGAQPLAAQPVAAPSFTAPAFDDSAWRAALAERDEQIAELQQAIIELADMRPGPVVEPVADPEILARLEEANRRIAALEARDGDEEVIAALVEANNRIMALEARTAEQEMAIRHTLTMLIEWIETEDYQRAAA